MAIGENKTESIRVRMTKSEKDMLQKIANDKRMPLSEVVRLLMFDIDSLSKRPSSDDLEMLKAIQKLKNEVAQYNKYQSKISNNINQLARFVNADNGFKTESRNLFIKAFNNLISSNNKFKERSERLWQSLK